MPAPAPAVGGAAMREAPPARAPVVAAGGLGFFAAFAAGDLLRAFAVAAGLGPSVVAGCSFVLVAALVSMIFFSKEQSGHNR